MCAAVFARVVCCVCFVAPWCSAYTCSLKSNDPTLKSSLVEDTHANYFFFMGAYIARPRCRLETRFDRINNRSLTTVTNCSLHFGIGLLLLLSCCCYCLSLYCCCATYSSTINTVLMLCVVYTCRRFRSLFLRHPLLV